MKTIFQCSVVGLFLAACAIPVFAQEVYTLPKPEITANLIAAIKAEAKNFPGVEVEASAFLPGTTRLNNITEVIFKFAKPENEGAGFLAPWLVAIFPLDQNLPVSDFYVQKRFAEDYDWVQNGFKGDIRVHERLKIFLEAVYKRLNQPEEP